ncbi:MAG: hypothetical protein N2450_08915 [bacterium]|nr:hypothetical protein [bacterium]
MILWYLGNELILGELEKQTDSFNFIPLHKLTIPIHSSPLVVKSAASREILLNAIKTLLSQINSQSRTIEVWLTPDWAYKDIVPFPEVPMEEFISQVRWEIEQRVNDLLDRYLLFQKQIPNEGIAFAVIRPSIVKFWRQLLFEFDFRLSSLRIADPENLKDVFLFDFATRAQGVPLPKTPVTKESGMTYHFSKKTIPIWVWLMIAFVVMLVGILLWKPWEKTSKSTKSQIAAVKTTPTSTAPIKQDTVKQSIQSGSTPSKKFVSLLKQIQSFATIEGATIVPGLISVQLITQEDITSKIQPVLSQLGMNAETHFSDQTDRLLILVPIEDFMPSSNFTMKSDRLTSIENSVEGNINEMFQWLETLNELPYRLVFVVEKENARVVAFN